MTRTNGLWVELKTLDDVDKQHEHCRVRKGEWRGPGWYYVTHYSQKCPRGCCYDAVCEITFAENRAEEIRCAMRDLAQELSDAKGRASIKVTA